MARVSREQAEKNRQAIEQASSRLFRERGLHGVSVADLMADAGLTHGGFYGHFASKDDLAALVCEQAFDEAVQKWTRRVARAAGDPHEMRANLVRPYLTAAHRDHPGEGCVASALVGDVAREPAGKPVRQAYADGIRQLMETWMQTVVHEDPAERRKLALAHLSTLIGAMTLARAMDGDPLSDEVLAAARETLLEGMASPKPVRAGKTSERA